MPFTVQDANKHKKGMSSKQARQWTHVANSELSKCIKAGGSDETCAPKAIRYANGVIKKQQEEKYQRDYGDKARDEDFEELGDDLKSYIDEAISQWTAPKDALIENTETEEAEEIDTCQECNEMNDDLVEYVFSEAVWSTKLVDSFPDSSFAVVMPGGKKDEEGKTVPRSNRKLPYKDASGKVDIPHLRNALARLKQMKGVSDALKAKAQKTLQAAAKKYLKSYQAEAETRDNMTESQKEDVFELALLLTEFDKPLDEFSSMVRSAFRSNFKPANENEYIWVRDVFLDHPTFGNGVVAEFQGINYLAPFEIDEDEEIMFSSIDSWKEVELTWRYVEENPTMPIQQSQGGEEEESEHQELAEVEIKENDETPIEMKINEAFNISESVSSIFVNESEYKEKRGTDRRSSLKAEMQFIAPGFGNSRDNNYYPKELMPKIAPRFEGAYIFLTDHIENEKNEKNKVGQIDKVVRYTSDGAPIAEITIFDPDTAEKTRNRAEAQKLHTLECSIAAHGSSVKGEVNGKKCNIVKEIDQVYSVDFVSRAGAGGKTVGLLESQSKEVDTVEDENKDVKTDEVKENEETPESTNIQEQKPETPPVLAKDKATELINASTLPKESKERLSEMEYPDEAKLKEVITKEIDYVVKLTKSGKPFESVSTATNEEKPTKSHDERMNEIFTRHGVNLYS